MFTAADASTACTDDGGAGVGAGCGDDTKEVGGAGDEAESDILLAGVICLYRYFVIFLLVLISFPTAKSFLQRIFTPKNFVGPSGHQIIHFFLKNLPNPTFFPKNSGKSYIFYLKNWANSFLQRIFTPKKKFLALRAKKFLLPTFFLLKKAKLLGPGRTK